MQTTRNAPIYNPKRNSFPLALVLSSPDEYKQKQNGFKSMSPKRVSLKNKRASGRRDVGNSKSIESKQIGGPIKLINILIFYFKSALPNFVI